MNGDFTDFFEDEPPIYGHGGARTGAGRKAASEIAAPDTPDDELTDSQRYHRARALKEVSLARQAAVKADLDEGAVVSRQAVRDAAAKAFSACSQSLDSIGDQLERDGFDPDVCERVMSIVNASKQQLADDLENAYELHRV